MAEIPSGGVPIWMEVHGDAGPGFVLVPGYQIVAGTRLFKFQVPFLAQRGRVVVYDQRGCGRSGRPVTPKHTLDEYVADLTAVVEASGLERFAMIAVSRGAEYAIRYAVA